MDESSLSTTYQTAEKEAEAFVEGSCEAHQEQKRRSISVGASKSKYYTQTLFNDFILLRQGGPRLRSTQVYPAGYGKFIAAEPCEGNGVAPRHKVIKDFRQSKLSTCSHYNLSLNLGCWIRRKRGLCQSL